MKMMNSLRWMFALSIIAATFLATQVAPHVLSATEDSEVKVIPNPHAATGSAACAGAEDDDSSLFPSDASSCDSAAPSSHHCETSFLLAPHRIIRTPMATQPDTLLEIITKKVLSVPVPVYRFHQPARLSHHELPFQLILVNDIDYATASQREDLHAIAVDPSAAADSWFLGYSWSPVVYTGCTEGIEEGPIHVGWKFTKNNGNNSSSKEEFFYALIVDSKEEEQSAVQVGIDALGEVIAQSFGTIGTRAPAWMIDLLTKY